MSLTRKQFLQLATYGTASLAARTVAGAAPIAEVPAGGPASAPAGATPTSGVTAAVVTFVLDARLERFPSKVIAEAKRCLIDGFGVVLGGATAQGSGIVRQYVRSSARGDQASVLGPEPLKAPVALAALANGASGHAMDWDDTQLSASPDRVYGLLTHPTVPAGGHARGGRAPRSPRPAVP